MTSESEEVLFLCERILLARQYLERNEKDPK